VLEVDKRIGRPEPLAQLVARDDAAGPLEQRLQQPQRLILKVDAASLAAQVSGSRVELERPEPRRAGAGMPGRTCPAP
jgi:hypothetical protein